MTKYNRNGQRWQEDEYELVEFLLNEGRTWGYIAAMLGRTVSTLKRQCLRKGIRRPEWSTNQLKTAATERRWARIRKETAEKNSEVSQEVENSLKKGQEGGILVDDDGFTHI